MKLFMKSLAHILFVCGLAIFYIFPRNKYDWMPAVESATTSLPVDQSAGSRLIFTATVLLVMILAQGLVIMKTPRKKEKIVSLLLILTATVIWSARYL